MINDYAIMDVLGKGAYGVVKLCIKKSEEKE